jgi:hypothetical protein
LRERSIEGAKYRDILKLNLTFVAFAPSRTFVSFRLDGYRNFALCYLKQVTHLDGLEVTSGDRAAAEDAYMESILKFNNKIEEVTREGRREAQAIEARRARTKSHGHALKEEMIQAFDMLEKLVKEGLSNLHTEHNRQIRVRKQNQIALESSLMNIATSFSSEVERQLEEEKRREETEGEAERSEK